METATGPRLYLLLAGRCYDSQGRPDDKHVSAGMVGALVVGLADNDVSIVAGDPRIPMGGWGVGPTDWTLVKLGPSDYWGWLNTLSYSGQGRTESGYAILAPYGKGIRDLASGIKAGFDDAGAYLEEDQDQITSIETRLDIFDTKSWSYVAPSDWPLADY